MAMPRRWEILKPGEIDVESSARMQAHSWLDTYLDPMQPDRNVEVHHAAEGFLMPSRLKLRHDLYRTAAVDPEQFLRVAVTPEQQTIGLLYGYLKKDGAAYELSAFYVDKQFHGTGLAYDMTDEFFDWTDPAIATEVGVVEDNIRAQRFYRNVGFVETGEPAHPVRAFGREFKYLREIDMIREV